jgi:1-acylglycerone phosphate reductase
MEIMAALLRLELHPFGVSVLSVVTGKSKGQSHFDAFTLPRNTIYKPIEGIIASKAQGNDGVPRMDTMEYATAVAEAMVERATDRFWYGNYADVRRYCTCPLPRYLYARV